MNEYVLTEDAELDLYEVLEYLEARNPTAAERWQRTMLAELASIASAPMLHRTRPEFAPAPVRVRVFGDYLIFYNPADKPLTIVRVVHGRRDLPFVLKSLEDADA